MRCRFAVSYEHADKERQEMEKPRILIVDDMDSEAESLRVLMENNGFDAHKETDPQKVRTRVRQESYDVVFLDILMPKYSGIDVLVDIKTFSPNTRVIMMTGDATRGQTAEAMRLGASDFLEKNPSRPSQAYIDKAKKLLGSEKSILREALIEYLRDRMKRISKQSAGRDLEALVKLVFESIEGFESVTSNVMTGIPEEIDLVIENRREDPIWSREGGLILVECKAWSKRIGKNEYGTFYRKLEKTHGRSSLGFFVSTSGFSGSFQREALTCASGNILIVPIGPDQLERLIETRERERVLRQYMIQATHSRI
jgi:CheY-like chemotaxis protein